MRGLDKTIDGNMRMPVSRKAMDVLRVQPELTKTQRISATSRCALAVRLANTRATQEAQSASAAQRENFRIQAQRPARLAQWVNFKIKLSHRPATTAPAGGIKMKPLQLSARFAPPVSMKHQAVLNNALCVPPDNIKI